MADEVGSEGEEVFGFAFVAQGEAAVSGVPGDGSFDHPPVSAKFVACFDPFAGDVDFDAAVTDPASARESVVGLVGVWLGRLAESWVFAAEIATVSGLAGARRAHPLVSTYTVA